jgi:hypothetical protein
LLAALAEPYTLTVNGESSIDVRIGASIGVAPYLESDRQDADEQLIQVSRSRHVRSQARRQELLRAGGYIHSGNLSFA